MQETKTSTREGYKVGIKEDPLKMKKDADDSAAVASQKKAEREDAKERDRQSRVRQNIVDAEALEKDLADIHGQEV